MNNNIILHMNNFASHIMLVAAMAAWWLILHTDGASPIVDCMPKAKDTFLCVDRETYCTSVNTSTIDHPEEFCDPDQRWYYDPKYACGCNVFCVDMIAQDGACKPSYFSNYPEALCDVGLDCLSVAGTEEYTCQQNPAKPCVKGKINYEKAEKTGTKGPDMLDPLCDYVGQYAPRQCSPSSTCYCVDEKGGRLFGEEIYTKKDKMDCECARHWSKNVEMGLTQGLRCLPNGNIDPLQCNEEFCYCYQANPPDILDGPYSRNMITLLSCYDHSYHSINYTNICKEALENFDRVNPDYFNGIVIGGGKAPVCDLDGYYDPVQPTDEGSFYCSNKTGQQIEDFAFTREGQSACHCATRRHLLSKADELVVSLPLCCSDGRYTALQSRGLFAYCVDTNGNQEGPTVPVTDSEKLSCKDTDCS